MAANRTAIRNRAAARNARRQPGPGIHAPLKSRLFTQADIPLGNDPVDEILASLRKPEPKSVGELAERMRQDYQFAFSEWILRAQIESVAVTVSTDSDDPRAVALAEQLQELWYDALAAMQDAIAFGRVAFEKDDFEYREVAAGVEPIQVIGKLEPLPYKYTEMEIGDDGGFAGIRLYGDPQKVSRAKQILNLTDDDAYNGYGMDGRRSDEGAASLVLPPVKSWWLSLDATAIEPHGRSRFLGAPKTEWEDRQELRELRRVFLQKFCLRGGVCFGPTAAEIESGTTENYAAGLNAAYKDLRTGGMMYIPSQRDKDGNRVPEFVESATVEDPTPIEAVFDKSDVRVLRSFGISEIAVQQTGDIGSFALALIHRLVLAAVVQSIVGQYAKSFHRYVVDKSAELNGIAAKFTVTFPDLTAIPDSTLVDLAKEILKNPQVSPLVAVVNFKSILEAAGIPLADDFDARFAKAMQLVQQASQSPQPQPPRGGAASLPRPSGEPNLMTLGEPGDGNELILLHKSVNNPEHHKTGAAEKNPTNKNKAESTKNSAGQKSEESKKPLATGTTKAVRTPGVKHPPPPQQPDSIKSERSKAAYNPSTKEKQDRSERLEQFIATALSLFKSGDNLPMDAVGGPQQNVGVEIKMLHDAKDNRVNMRKDSRQRKEEWVNEKEGRKAYTVIYDGRDTYQAGLHKDKYSGNKYYWKEGVGAFGLSTMNVAKNITQLKQALGLG